MQNADAPMIEHCLFHLFHDDTDFDPNTKNRFRVQFWGWSFWQLVLNFMKHKLSLLYLFPSGTFKVRNTSLSAYDERAQSPRWDSDLDQKTGLWQMRGAHSQYLLFSVSFYSRSLIVWSREKTAAISCRSLTRITKKCQRAAAAAARDGDDEAKAPPGRGFPSTAYLFSTATAPWFQAQTFPWWISLWSGTCNSGYIFLATWGVCHLLPII